MDCVAADALRESISSSAGLPKASRDTPVVRVVVVSGGETFVWPQVLLPRSLPRVFSFCSLAALRPVFLLLPHSGKSLLYGYKHTGIFNFYVYPVGPSSSPLRPFNSEEFTPIVL